MGRTKLVKIWVDDIRPKPDDYDFRVKSVFGFIYLLGKLSVAQRDNPILLNLDHDAGEYVAEGGDYIKILEFLDANLTGAGCPVDTVRVCFHSGNPVGVKNMRRIVAHSDCMMEVKDEDLD